MPLFSGNLVLNSSILRDQGGRRQMRGRMHESSGESIPPPVATGSYNVNYDPHPLI